MITVEGQSVDFKEGMSAYEAIKETKADASNAIVLVNETVVQDMRTCLLHDGDEIRLLTLVSGG